MRLQVDTGPATSLTLIFGRELAMDSSKDFAKSKRKATQRHTPGRGGRGFPGSKRSSAKAELGSNVER